ncbi:hypothetical protein FACS1894120_4770 [Clostridia bacterium]|nr:hypothetical protein FACS1894120_4770 [Clostridia bacterium]
MSDTEKAEKAVKSGMSEAEATAYFNEVYAREFKPVSRFVVNRCRGIRAVSDSEDLIQNIFTRFYKYVLKNGCSEIQNVQAFLINIAKFECRTFVTHSVKNSKTDLMSEFSEERMMAIDAELSASASEQPALADAVEGDILAKQIFADIAKSDPVTGKIFYLHFVCDQKLQDVAEALDIPLQSVKNKLYRTLERQKKKFNM